MNFNFNSSYVKKNSQIVRKITLNINHTGSLFSVCKIRELEWILKLKKLEKTLATTLEEPPLLYSSSVGNSWKLRVSMTLWAAELFGTNEGHHCSLEDWLAIMWMVAGRVLQLETSWGIWRAVTEVRYQRPISMETVLWQPYYHWFCQCSCL